MKDRYVNKAIVGMIDSVDDITDTMCNILIHGINRKFLVPKWWTVTNKVVVCFKGFQFRNKKLESDYLVIPISVLQNIKSKKYIVGSDVSSVLSNVDTSYLVKEINMNYIENYS
nr:MAG TPA: hypothetical protein [Bacteriophage sp.]